MTQEMPCVSHCPQLDHTNPPAEASAAVETSFEARQLTKDINEGRECIAGLGVTTAVIR